MAEDANVELAITRANDAQDAAFQKDLDPVEARLRVLENWKAAEDALSAVRRWAMPIFVTAAGLTLNIGIAIATHKH